MTLSSKHSFLLSLYSVVHLVSSVLRLAHLAVARQGTHLLFSRGEDLF